MSYLDQQLEAQALSCLREYELLRRVGHVFLLSRLSCEKRSWSCQRFRLVPRCSSVGYVASKLAKCFLCAWIERRLRLIAKLQKSCLVEVPRSLCLSSVRACGSIYDRSLVIVFLVSVRDCDNPNDIHFSQTCFFIQVLTYDRLAAPECTWPDASQPTLAGHPR